MTDNTKIINRDVEKEMKKSFLDYSMSVIVSRALPDVRDGLKPVHRRILYTMHERGLEFSKGYRKSAETVGAVLGSYHPHGDASVYDALVRMAQDFSLRYPLVDGQGNFGSVDGDPPAAYRYTEARMSKVAVDLLTDLDKETVDFMPNYDDTNTEPTVLPSRIPNLLINGSTGIAVGMATNIPPHNIVEVISAVCMLLENPDAELIDIMEHIEGPDFPTGGIIMGRSGIRAAYATGRGKIMLRGRADFEEQKNGRVHIIITEIPYMVNKSRLLEAIAELVKDKRIEGISDLRDESDREGMRIVVELKKDAIPQVVLNQLYKYTQLQDTVGVIMLALDKGIPKVMDLKTMLQKYIEFQKEIIERRTRYDLRKAQERAHILNGLLIAQDNIDEVISIIRSHKTINEGKAVLIERFSIDDIQASAIVALRIGQLAGLEREKLQNEYDELKLKIADLLDILAREDRVRDIILSEINALKEKYKDARRTSIEDVAGEVDIEDLIPVEDCVYTLTHMGYIKRMPVDVYQSQKRGGRGVQGLTRREEDFVRELFIASTHDYILFVTTRGVVYRVKGYQIPEGQRTAKGTNLINLIPLQPGESVTGMLKVQPEQEGNLVMVTEKGIIKCSRLEQYRNIRKSGLIAINLDEGDCLAWTNITSGSDELIVGTYGGMAIRFNEKDLRVLGRGARGVKAVTLKKEDKVVGVSIVTEGGVLLTVSEGGKGRFSELSQYRLQNRGGKGITNYKKDKVAGIRVMDRADDIILISSEGIVIRMKATDINIQSRYGSGVRVMRLSENDKVVTVAATAAEILMNNE